MKRMLRAAALLIAAALLSPCASALSACRAAVLDADTGEVCFARNASEHALIASTTKIMTGLLIAEDCDPDAVVTVPQEAVGIEGSSLYLKAGEQLTVRALLYGLLLHSGNDAAVALALAHSGSVGAFVEAMNGRARELGLQDTHFTNPNGLDAPEHYSTALDLTRLTRAALQVPAFAEVAADHDRGAQLYEPQPPFVVSGRRDRREDGLYPRSRADARQRRGTERTAAHCRHAVRAGRLAGSCLPV